MADWKTTALIASLAVNLLGIGAFAGAKWRHHGHHGPHGHFGHHGAGKKIERIVSQLPEEKRTEVKTLFDSHQNDRKAHHQKMRDLIGQLKEVVKTDQFDETAFKDIDQKINGQRAAFSQKRSAFFLKMAKLLNKEQRMQVMRLLKKRRGPHRRHKGRRHHKDG